MFENRFFNLPNILSMSRIVFLPLLYVFIFRLDEPYMKLAFISLYILLGLTDFFDGRIARKYDICSELGSALDSLGDVFLYLSSAYFIYALAEEAIITNFWFLIFMLASLVLLVIIGLIKFGKPKLLHTITGKVGAMMVFFLVIVSTIADPTLFLFLTILMFVVHFYETILIIFMYGDVSPDTFSIFHVEK